MLYLFQKQETDVQRNAAVQERVGFSLRVQASSVGHEGNAAGDGVWLRGSARAGAVVGLYPGIVYTRAFYRLLSLPMITV